MSLATTFKILISFVIRSQHIKRKQFVFRISLTTMHANRAERSRLLTGLWRWLSNRAGQERSKPHSDFFFIGK